MKRIIRDRKLTPEEAAKYNAIREQVEREKPEITARIRDRVAAARRTEIGDNGGSRTWSEWFSLDIKSPRNPAQNLGTGVYRIRLTDSTGTPVTIPRALGVDADGIIYIGAGNLCDRIGILMDITRDEPPKEFHNLATTWRRFDLSRLGDRRRLQVQFRICKNEFLEEQQELVDYKTRFGDMPVGNVKL